MRSGCAGLRPFKPFPRVRRPGTTSETRGYLSAVPLGAALRPLLRMMIPRIRRRTSNEEREQREEGEEREEQEREQREEGEEREEQEEREQPEEHEERNSGGRAHQQQEREERRQQEELEQMLRLRKMQNLTIHQCTADRREAVHIARPRAIAIADRPGSIFPPVSLSCF